MIVSSFVKTSPLPNWEYGRLSMADLSLKVTRFVKNVNIIFNIKRSWSKQGGQLYWAILFSKVSLPIPNDILD